MHQGIAEDECNIIVTGRGSQGVMGLFHWSRPVGIYVFFQSWDQCLQGWLGSVVVLGLSGRVSEISNMFDISMTFADPCNRP